MKRNNVRIVHADRYNPVNLPNLWKTHSVRTNPSGQRLLMIGPKKEKRNIGRPPARAYTSKPWRPAEFATWGYVARTPHPIP
jgi:hypothetical protein